MVTVISVSLPDDLVKKIDAVVSRQGYRSRSDLIKAALQAFIDDGEDSGRYRLITVLSDHESSPYVDKNIVGLIHTYSSSLKALYHQILEDSICITIAIVGDEDDWRTLVRRLRSLNGVVSVHSIPI